MQDYERSYEEFWKDLIENEDGTLNKDRLKRELHDYRMIIENASKIYDHVTAGRFSKPNALAEDVIAEADIHYEEHYKNIWKKLENGLNRNNTHSSHL